MEQVLTNNKESVRALFEKISTESQFNFFKDYISEEYVGLDGKKGPEAFAAPLRGLKKAAPDLHYDMQELIAEGDKIGVRWIVKGVQTGPLPNMPNRTPTGKPFANAGMAIFVFKEGKIVKSDLLTDRLGFLQEIGVLPKDLSQVQMK